jgi:hypothetical protein
MDLSIIIVNWNSADYLRACLASVYVSVRETQFEIIVVDNGSRDGCEAMLREHFPKVHFIGASKNLGFARANNLGYLESKGRTLLFLNPDTEVIADALDRMCAWLDAHPSAGAVGACLYNADGSVQRSCVQAFPTLANQLLDADLLRQWFPKWRIWGTAALEEPRRGPAEVDAISGACFLVRREVFEAAGRFTEDYFMFSDDLDLSYKIRHGGYSVVCLTDCAVLHYGGRSSSQRGPSFAAVEQRHAMSQFFRRTRGPLCSAVYRLLTCAAAIFRLCIAVGMLSLTASPEKRQELRSVLIRWRSVLYWAMRLETKFEGVQSSHGY